MTYYVVAQDKTGKESVLSVDAVTRITAINDIVAQANEKGLYVDVDQVRVVRGTAKGESTITKRFKERKAKRGRGERTDWF
jgi:hypothetical protein